MTAKHPPQSFISSYAPRLRTYANNLITPNIPPAVNLAAPLSRTTKRGTTAINYAEDGYDDYDEDTDENRRRPTGLRSIQRPEIGQQVKQDPGDKVGKETKVPVEVQGVWRDWMGKHKSVPAKPELAAFAQTALPLTLVPIRIDLDIPAFTPQPALPYPQGGSYGIDQTNAAYRTQEQTVPYRLRDYFLWNLHETLATTDQFAQTMVQDLDLPNRVALANDISKQIRSQLEEYAGISMHTLFQTGSATETSLAPPAYGVTRELSVTPAASGNATPMRNGVVSSNGLSTPSRIPPSSDPQPEIKALATSIAPEADDFNPDDVYRCIVNLNINVSNYQYTDKFEWSLVHPPGTAEVFAKQTCADLGLPGEWVPAMTHAIYEAVLRLKKEYFENGGNIGGEIPNETAHGAEAGWRYDNETLGSDWEPRIELLSKDDMEARELDRQRQIRRVRRETARISSTVPMLSGTPQAGAGGSGYFDQEPAEERMGRGERSKKKKRFRSLSPLRGGTPGGRGTPDIGGIAAYGAGGSLNDYERSTWRCTHCHTWGTAVWTVRDGPHGPRTLCNICGFLFEHNHTLPKYMKDLHKEDKSSRDFR